MEKYLKIKYLIFGNLKYFMKGGVKFVWSNYW